MTQFEVLVMGM